MTKNGPSKVQRDGGGGDTTFHWRPYITCDKDATEIENGNGEWENENGKLRWKMRNEKIVRSVVIIKKPFKSRG